MNSELFSPMRFARFLLMEIADMRRMLVRVVLVIVLGVMLINLFTEGLLHSGNAFLIGGLLGNLLILGMIHVAYHGEKAGNMRTGALYQLLPASVLEKFLSRFIITGPLFYLTVHVLFQGISAACQAGVGFLPQPELLLKPRPLPGFSETAGIFFMLHAVYFCCGNIFRKGALGITTGIVFGTLVLAQAITIVAFHFLCRDMPHMVTMTFTEAVNRVSSFRLWNGTDQVVFYGLLLPVLWIASYRTFREREL